MTPNPSPQSHIPGSLLSSVSCTQFLPSDPSCLFVKAGVGRSAGARRDTAPTPWRPAEASWGEVCARQSSSLGQTLATTQKHFLATTQHRMSMLQFVFKNPYDHIRRFEQAFLRQSQYTKFTSHKNPKTTVYYPVPCTLSILDHYEPSEAFI